MNFQNCGMRSIEESWMLFDKVPYFQVFISFTNNHCFEYLLNIRNISSYSEIVFCFWNNLLQQQLNRKKLKSTKFRLQIFVCRKKVVICGRRNAK
jgi:hypothetical protein